MPDEPALLPDAPGDYGPAGRSAWLDVDWHEHQRWVTVDGRRVNVVELGSGPPVVFIHGLSGSWQNWLEQLPVFAREHRVIAFDLPGFGESEMPAQKITISGYGRFVEALMDELGLGSAAVVGNSMGGFIGIELGIRFPQRVERLVLVSAAGLSIQSLRNERSARGARRARQPAGGLHRLAGLALGDARAAPGVAADDLRGRRAPSRAAARPARRRAGPRLGQARFRAALDALTDYPIRDRLGEIACPTLIVWGAEDKLVPARDADEFARLIPNARKVVWPDTGHVAMLERPAAFNALLEAFLDEEPGERVSAQDAAGAA